MLNKQLHKCCICKSNIAQWKNQLAPKDGIFYFCDKCVPRNDISNVKNIDDFGEPDSNANVMWWSEFSLKKDFKKNGTLTREKDSYYYEIIGEDFRRKPSSDFLYKKDGFNKKEEEKQYILYFSDIMNTINSIELKGVFDSDLFEFKDVAEEIYIKHKNKLNSEIIDYNLFMSKLGYYFVQKYSENMAFNVNEIRAIYNDFKIKIKKLRKIE